MDTWAGTDNLILDSDGILWRVVRTEEDAQWRRLGPIATAEVPGELVLELAELLDLWLDAFDARADQLWHHRLAIGAG